MAYDEHLAERVRERIAGETRVTEQRMFGGLGFMIAGNMAVAASNDGGLLVRANPADTDRLLGEHGVSPMVMRGREMAGWLRVAAAAVDTDDALQRWVSVGVDYARSLPAKIRP